MASSIRARYRGHLPKTLSADFESNAFPRYRFGDPQTGRRYEYRRAGDERFRLCAKFSAPSDPDAEVEPSGYLRDWPHPAGLFCKNYVMRDESGSTLLHAHE